jgi:hypothetical protein
MTKLADTLARHSEMTPIGVTRLEIAKVSEPGLRAGLEAIVDLIELAIGDGAPIWSLQTLAEPPMIDAELMAMTKKR